MKWIRYIEEQPKDGSIIVECTDPFELYTGDFKNHYSLLVKEYRQYLPWNEYVAWSVENEQQIPNFWWIYAYNFPFPDQAERLSEKTSKEDAIV